MTAKVDLPPVPNGLADVAYVDGPSIAAAGGMSISMFLQEVREQRAPQPAIQQPRFTRWRLSDARAWLVGLAEQRSAEQAAAVTEKARRASLAARTPEALAKARAARQARVAHRQQLPRHTRAEGSAI